MDFTPAVTSSESGGLEHQSDVDNPEFTSRATARAQLHLHLCQTHQTSNRTPTVPSDLLRPPSSPPQSTVRLFRPLAFSTPSHGRFISKSHQGSLQNTLQTLPCLPLSPSVTPTEATILSPPLLQEPPNQAFCSHLPSPTV